MVVVRKLYTALVPMLLALVMAGGVGVFQAFAAQDGGALAPGQVPAPRQALAPGQVPASGQALEAGDAAGAGSAGSGSPADGAGPGPLAAAAGSGSGDGSLSTQAVGFVVVLDPGHGGYDGGATGIGFYEKDANLAIAEYCKAKLEETPGITVYMTRTTDKYVSLDARTQFAVDHDADVIVSLHNNSANGNARGSDVIVPREGTWYYKETYMAGQELGGMIIEQLKTTGVPTHGGVWSRDNTLGSTYDDGTLEDYYKLINGPRWYGILGIIVEHAFVDNADDAAFLRNDANLKKLGEADAQAIAEYFEHKAAASDSEPMRRLYNPYSGEHFYTASLVESAGLVSQGWVDEGVGWVAPPSSGTPVYRLYNSYAGDHHYTMNSLERTALISAGWTDEGIGWYSDDAETVPLYRQYNPNQESCNHNYTTDKGEHDNLVSEGWIDEGIAWYGFEAGGPADGATADADGAIADVDDSAGADAPADAGDSDAVDEPAIADEPIMGASQATVDQMVRRFDSMGKTYPSDVYAQYGAKDIGEFCQVLYEEAEGEGVRAEVVFAQAMHETGWLQFGGDVSAEQCNFAGIGATGGVPGNSFNTYGADSVRMGLRAQVQHLKAYASTDALNNDVVDPRFTLVTRGCAPTVQGLSGRWATGSTYGDSLCGQVQRLLEA